jgi:hypothetical protein
MTLPASHYRRLLPLARANLTRLCAEREDAAAWRWAALDKQIANVEAAITKMESRLKKMSAN